ncbi:ThuA domain-containing protein [Marinilongibacter aquaticus]|uniref:ThuA domain-containing protein n=1 Tax=Marinilongibacter aquaticus TaxID=2975157 RepID=UPI00286D6F95|nr:ThuA domain-containing protein [Marinilongibacter aquaticus]
MKKTFTLLLFLLFVHGLFAQTGKINVLVFSKTAAFRHPSIEKGKEALGQMAKEKGFAVSFSEDAAVFKEPNLKKFNVVLFLNTTGDILNDTQQSAFERYIQAGGGYVGVHAATDTEYDWPWYNGLAGAWFLDHPMNPSNVQKGRFYVTKRNAFTKGMPDEFEREDEFYSFRNISPDIDVLVKIDESSYIGGKNGDDHPISWYHEFDGGRAFYTAMGHTDETYDEPLFLNHLWEGIKYAAGGENPKAVDFSKARPEENRFTKVVLEEKLDEPMELTLLDKDRILFIQRKGEVRLYNVKSKELKTIAKIPVSNMYVNKEGKESMGEDGLLGLNKDPHFAENHWIYLYYSTPEASRNILTRYEMRGDELLLDSKKILLEIPTQREECCHTGGSIAWDKAGNLYLSTGDNTNPHGSDGYSPSDERPGRSAWDAQKSSANTNDLRGKILRIKPQADGSYTIPEGNLFPKGTPKTRPEIYTMGHRNPFRIAVDQHTGYLYWGEVGPDASKPDSTRGPAGHDEVGQARKAGNFGWPHFVGDNKAYNKYDFANEVSHEKWDVAAPTNNSPNNTGLNVLPPAQEAFIWYPYSESKEFPLVGSGGRNAMAGPVFYSADFKGAERPFPNYYNGKFFEYDWMRGWIMAVSMNEQGDFKSMERFMPSYKFSNPMDMEFAENGDLYMLEYGSGWFTANDDARLIRIEFNAGNRKPQIQLSASEMGGQAPFRLTLSSEGTTDPDGDPLKYTWTVSSSNGYKKTFNTATTELTLDKVGTYKALLSVDDGNGGSNAQALELIVGNAPPKLTVEMPEGNKSFFAANKNFQYKINVSDPEDGQLGAGINPEEVAVSIDYLPEGYDKVQIAQGHRSADANAAFAKGRSLIADSDCMACHSKEKKSIGPSYRDVSEKYKKDDTALERLTKKVISGGSGVWGETAMAGHPQLSTEEAAEMVKYILNVSKEVPQGKTLPTEGVYMAKIKADDKGQGVYIVRAAYTDHGAKGVPSLRSEQACVLRNTKLDVHAFDAYDEINKLSFGGNNLAIPSKTGSFMLLKQVDLNAVQAIQVAATAPKPQLNAIGGKVEVRLGSPKGTLIGTSEMLSPSDKMDFTPSILQIPLRVPQSVKPELQDVYLVFSNPDGGTGSLMVVMGVEFVLASNGSADAAQVQEGKATDYFVGQWQTTFLDTPNGDAELLLDLQREGESLVGTITPQNADGKAEGVQLDKVEENGQSITIYFKMMGYDLNATLEKVDEANMSGKLMNMFEVVAKRASNDPFVGKWDTQFLDTPNGDAELLMELVRENGDLKGTMTPKTGGTEAIILDKIEEGTGHLTLYFEAQGYNLEVQLDQVDEDHLQGTLMGQFEVKASRAE